MESGHGRLFTQASRRHQFHLRREGASLAGLLAGWLAGSYGWLEGWLAGTSTLAMGASIREPRESSRILSIPNESQVILDNSYEFLPSLERSWSMVAFSLSCRSTAGPLA